LPKENPMRIEQTASSSIDKRATINTIPGANSLMTNLIPLLLATVLGVVGQLLLKQGMLQLGAVELDAASIPATIWRMATSPYVFGGLLVYGSGTFFWLVFISRVPLSYSYPFVSLGIILGLLAAWGIFHESIPPIRWVGMLVVCLGVILVARS
jgi:multidrug transporter EmrE-like cation transporter